MIEKHFLGSDDRTDHANNLDIDGELSILHIDGLGVTSVDGIVFIGNGKGHSNRFLLQGDPGIFGSRDYAESNARRLEEQRSEVQALEVYRLMRPTEFSRSSLLDEDM